VKKTEQEPQTQVNYVNEIKLKDLIFMLICLIGFIGLAVWVFFNY
jgi:hypothetical protein